MTAIGVHLNDAAFAVSGGDRPTSVEPSVIHSDRDKPEVFGSSGRAVVRQTPRSVSADHWTALARMGRNVAPGVREIIRAELRNRLPDSTEIESLQCAVPAIFGTESLGTVLSLMRLEGLIVDGFHDAAALMVATLGLEGITLVLEMGLGHLSVTRVDSTGEVRRKASTSRYGAGVLALEQCWLQRIAEAMVLQTRFDPLHDGLTEQRLYDQLDAACAAATKSGAAEIELATSQGVTKVSLSRDQLAEAASAVYDQAISALHELRPAGAYVNILIDSRLLGFPGVLERLSTLRDCRVFSHVSDLAARAAANESLSATPDGSVSIQRGYPRRVPIDAPQEIDLSNFPAASDIAPTHVLFDGKAIVLPSGLFEIGRNPQNGGLRLSEGLAGVSRLHCSLQAERSGVTLVPHTSQGTWLNDERVRTRVKVRSGDRLRIGTPGVTLDLIAVGGADHGAPSQR